MFIMFTIMVFNVKLEPSQAYLLEYAKHWTGSRMRRAMRDSDQMLQARRKSKVDDGKGRVLSCWDLLLAAVVVVTSRPSSSGPRDLLDQVLLVPPPAAARTASGVSLTWVQ